MKGYQLKITVKGSKPPVWRRIIVPETATFHQLHEMIQEAFGWSGYHLHEFEFSKKNAACKKHPGMRRDSRGRLQPFR